MATWKQFTAVLLGAAILSSLCIPAAEAKPSKGKKGEQSILVHPTTSSTQTTTLSFSSEQRTQLTALLSGRVIRNDVLNVSTRNLVASQISSLPRGIQKRLARGKGLPPGIAKKVILPKTVNTYLNIPAQYELVVIGSNVVLCDSATKIVVDFIAQFI
ncbi:hypothetical protein NIES2135_34410 [Leptolyngbya boryana NIES-2135]|jgi:hypothetical protein|uniref:Lipoprotein n=1 Tax=Leptolyngbya boryana NIES-2135 TaxID=1973484 RepID=A0A1Z4JJ80_LEPBY|nr:MULTISPECIES: hypothetical protein [Leptolyngbya]BAY56607.1 hypothetical protein NIES2135_34410 [Leptolyngbya boryana NIES-2135]MBD2369909.1 hypothetical protein [Leptolyngbya sp. FACHB-161]MBD2376146.1 hypothetical protein [Leptolyngbya sp. FACHB-238]MBD2400421.1 hypothetical protein [Leptolyngbya sp. FACHB-239]MBD2406963.1 hypothetical protein [Leptolyngbya sp. FACHB-402]